MARGLSPPENLKRIIEILLGEWHLRQARQAPTITRTKLELYHWVSSYRRDGLSIEKACEKALDEHPEHDAYESSIDDIQALKKLVQRLDKHPRLTQRALNRVRQ